MQASRFILLTICFILFSGCSETKTHLNSEQQHYPFIDSEDPFAIPDEIYKLPSQEEDASILHPTGFLSALSANPETECEREELRRLVIAINMYSLDRMNQTYYIETDTSGAKVLETAFPEIKKLYGEGGKVLNIGSLSEYLRGVDILCRN